MTAQRHLALPTTPAPAMCEPLLRYAGSKRWLAPLLVTRLHAHLTKVNGVYVEPFAGSVALGLSLGWHDSVYSDVCPDIANLHRTVRDEPDALFAACADLAKLPVTEEAFYEVRERQRRHDHTEIEWAAIVLYLVGRGFNGLWRTNKKGQHNAPVGRDSKGSLYPFSPPSIEHLRQASEALRGATIADLDFAKIVAMIVTPPKRLVAYLDPPYHGTLKNISGSGGASAESFTGYAGGFTWADQVRLATQARDLASRGACVIASNAWTDEVCDLWREGFQLFQMGVRHSVGATGDRRGKRAEMLAISEAHAGLLESTPARTK